MRHVMMHVTGIGGSLANINMHDQQCSCTGTANINMHDQQCSCTGTYNYNNMRSAPRKSQPACNLQSG